MPKVYVFPADASGCGSYRLGWPAEAARAQGLDVVICPPTDRQGFGGGIDSETGRVVEVNPPEDADVIVLQRVTHTNMRQAIPLLRAKGIAVVIDIDDDLTCIHPANPAYDMYHPRTPNGHSWQYALDAMRDATLVTVSAEALLPSCAPHGRGRVLPNCVPAAYLDIPHTDSTVIGWGGSLHSHPDDLSQVGLSIARLVDEGQTFRVIGPSLGIAKALGLAETPQATGNVGIAAWAAALSTLGIGITPLADSRFNASKSYLKPLEMMAAGVPWVASPRAEYTRLHKLGAGLLARKPRDWYRHLNTLVRDDALRQDMSAAGRALAATLTIERNAWRWAEAWNEAYRIQRQAARTTVKA